MVFKSNFAGKLLQLKNNGQAQETLHNLQIWIEENLDSLFESYNKNPSKNLVFKPTTLEYVKNK